MISILKQRLASSVEKNKIEYDKFIARAKTRLDGAMKIGGLYTDEMKYIKEIHENIEKIVYADFHELTDWITHFEKIIPACIIENDASSAFRNKIIERLDYDKLRSDLLRKIFSALEIKACVYCNSMLTIAYEQQDNIYKARLQADHYYPKNKFPFLAISIYNLYPSCGPCNNVKGVKQIEFELHSEKQSNISDFKFELKGLSLSKYLLNRDLENLEIGFKEPTVCSPNQTFNSVFDLTGIYSTQKDLAVELINKAEHYTKHYRYFLHEAFNSVMPVSSLSGKLLIGNYTEPEEIHKRPMAKFTQDIARQLKLID